MNGPVSSPATPFDAALERAEQALEQVTQRLATREVDGLEAACQTLQQAILACSHSAGDGQFGSQRPLRLQKLYAGFALAREGLARQASMTQRSLQTLLPSSGPATYGRQAAAFTRGDKTAAFTSLSA